MRRNDLVNERSGVVRVYLATSRSAEAPWEAHFWIKRRSLIIAFLANSEVIYRIEKNLRSNLLTSYFLVLNVDTHSITT